ncbi:DUF6515 family protein [Kaarinaea lacus]
MKNFYLKSAVLLVTLMAVLSFTAYADKGGKDRDDNRGRPDHSRSSPPPPDFRMDKRYEHNRHYPPPGYSVKVVPERRHIIHYHDRDYFYFGGVWYLPSGPSFVVVRPPLGVIVPILPPFYTTIWLGGIPYYYANDVYYVWRADLNGYQVTSPPIKEDEPPPPYRAEELFAYPKEGQSEEQQADDRYACHRWGVEQTGYDPTQPPTNLSVSELSKKREDYQRAMKACLEGKGYSVR